MLLLTNNQSRQDALSVEGWDVALKRRTQFRGILSLPLYLRNLCCSYIVRRYCFAQ